MLRLVDKTEFERSLGEGRGPYDEGLADYAIAAVSAEVLYLTGREWTSPEDLPAIVAAYALIASRRMYTNPDNFSRESEGSYTYALDASVTNADIFTPHERATIKRFAALGYQPDEATFGTVSTKRGDVYVNRGPSFDA